MAKDTTGIEELFENPEALQDQLTKTEQFAKQNQNLIIGVTVGIVMVVGGLMYNQWNKAEQNKKAQAELFPAIFYFEKDSLGKASKGDNGINTIGFEKIAKQYGGTQGAGLASFYLGVSKLQEGKYDEAINYLKDFSANDLLIQARAYSLIGDAYMEKNDLDEAIVYYKKAAEHHPNESFTPTYLLKLGLAHELKKDFANAALAYRTITTDFKESTDFVLAQKKLARVDFILNRSTK
jgi:predicted negative regulator of RcsB-dependent stress response